MLLSDGAEWIDAVQALLFDGLGVRVVHILDLRRAEEHLWEVARACLGERAAAWIADPLADLQEGQVDALLVALRQLPTPAAEAAKLVATTCTYFDARRAMLDYPRFRQAGSQSAAGLPRALANGW